MNIKKTRMSLAMAAIGLCLGTAQIAEAGLVEVNVVAGKIPTFSTDISGPGSQLQPFFAPDVRWSPGEPIGTNSTLRFNLGGIAGLPANFTTNVISVDNFYWKHTRAINTWTTAPVFVNAGGATAALTAAQLTAQLNALGLAVTSTSAQLLAAINAAGAASTVLPAALVSTAAADTPLMVAAANGALAPADAAAGVGAALVNVYMTGTSVSKNAFPMTVIGGIRPVASAAGSRVTNGDSATWTSITGVPYGRIFQTTTAGGLLSFDVSVTINPALVGDSTLAGLGDSVTMSLNSGKFVNNLGVPVRFATGPRVGTRVDLTHLKRQGFDGLPVLPTANPDGNGKLRIFASIQQGGATKDIAIVKPAPYSNAALLAASGSAFTSSVFAGANGSVLAASFPTTINTATGEVRFSLPGVASASWFANALDAGTNVNHLGSFKFNVGALITGITYDNFTASSITSTQVSDPNGATYALTAGDVIKVKVTSTTPTGFNAFAGTGGRIYLRPSTIAGACRAPGVIAGDIALTPVAGVAPLNATASNAAAPLNAGTKYDLCVVSNNATIIQAQRVSLSMVLNNVEPTFRDPPLPGGTMGSLVRNGCAVTFFNVPANAPGTVGADVAFLRFTNTTTNTVRGTVRATVWAQNGTLLGASGSLLTSTSAPLGLGGHQTGIYNATDIATAIGLAAPVAPAKSWAGRARVVLSGGFLTCEGQNMIRSGNGTLTNLTATTNANTNAGLQNLVTPSVGTPVPVFKGNNSN